MPDGADEEELAAAGSLDDEPGDGGEDGVDDHVDTAEEERHVGSLVDRLLEQDREVVDDGIAATDLLEQLGRRAKQATAEVLGLTTGQEVTVTSLSEVARCADGVHNNSNFHAGLLLVDGVATESGNDLGSFVMPVLGQEETRGLRQSNHGDGNNKTEQALESDWEAPRQVLATIRASVVRPVRNHGAKGNDTTLDTDEQTTVGGLRTFGLVSLEKSSISAQLCG